MVTLSCKVLSLEMWSVRWFKLVESDHPFILEDIRKKPFIELGKKFEVTIRAFVMTTSHDHAKHNNVFREMTDQKHDRIKDMILNQYRSRYVEPLKAEGFTEIIKVNCVPEFDDESLENLYYMALLEK